MIKEFLEFLAICCHCLQAAFLFSCQARILDLALVFQELFEFRPAVCKYLVIGEVPGI